MARIQGADMHNVIKVSLVVLLTTTARTGSPASSPTDGGQAGPTCRNSVTASTQVTRNSAFVATQKMSCTYNPSTFQLTCPFTHADDKGGAYTAVQEISYKSTADFVDEIRVIPPLTHWTRTSFTADVGGIRTSAQQTNSFDGQGRLLRNVATNPGATPLTTTYTTWDSAGRPTVGSISTSPAATTTSVSYNDAARTETRTNTMTGLPPITFTTTYDVNGNSTQTVFSGGAVSTSTTTIGSTARVCR